ncbi:hypothetical protein [Embleya sp. NBC_00896]|uniref:hypothetical protein n=1 Tax=Embleya sp. NBC_00896 TaxID=2975961 RepID=UPI002F90CFCD|nr:hypothetical protein OG928_33860 [Embleya sp. NBC_00896]
MAARNLLKSARIAGALTSPSSRATETIRETTRPWSWARHAAPGTRRLVSGLTLIGIVEAP